jgi:23S rRNA pseudouridine1911/1915/1917 synthase
MQVLYCDNHILVAVKPPNMPSQADASGDMDALTELKGYIGIKYGKPGNVYLGLVHRLDRPAGGVMVFARTSKAAARLGAQFQAHAQGRKYLAVLEGEPGGARELTDFLVKGADGMVRVVGEGTPGAKRATLVTAPVAARDGLTLAEVELMTGRAHQIRVQHAHIGHPLWGDMRYGNGVPGRQLALWAYSLSFAHPTRDEILTFRSKPPRSGAWEAFYDIIDERFPDAQG